MKIYTITELKNNYNNKIFFGNARFHGDYKYDINSKDKILTVYCKGFENAKRIVKYRIEDDGTIGDAI